MLLATLSLLLSTSVVATSVVATGDQDQPKGLTIIVVDVGQGGAVVIRSPDGTVHVYDGGIDGQGSAAVVPVVRSLSAQRYGCTFLSHYDPDHVGGRDEVLKAFPFSMSYDRGDTRRSNNKFVTSYLNAAGSNRRLPSPGQVIDLGGGATATVIAVNGQIKGGQKVPVSGQYQEENARSLALRIDYGQFSMWLGGDLTGGGRNTPDVESPAAVACGDVDVYQVDHHGSVTSTNATLVQKLSPELAVASMGENSAFGHPHKETINILNSRAASRVVLSTALGSRWLGYSSGGNVAIHTDGNRYRAVVENGDFLDFFVDEVRHRAPDVGDLRISEVHRDPLRVGDTVGEYIEIINVGVSPVSLDGLRLADSGGSFVIAGGALWPGRCLIFCPSGQSTENGGLPLAHVWPYQAIGLSNSETIVLSHGSRIIDRLSYTSGFAGGSGVAAERLDLLASTTPAGFGAARWTYGAGDRGTPGKRNSIDQGGYPARAAVEVAPGRLVLRSAALSHGRFLNVIGLSFGRSPGFSFLGRTIPLNPDPLFSVALQLPGFIDALPAQGYRSLDLPLPLPNKARGLRGFCASIILDIRPPGSVPTLSAAEPFVFK